MIGLIKVVFLILSIFCVLRIGDAWITGARVSSSGDNKNLKLWHIWFSALNISGFIVCQWLIG